MKSFTEYLTLNTSKRRDFVNLTRQVEEALGRSGIREGLCLVNAMHITASVFINDDEHGLHHDFAAWLEQLAPFDPSTEPLPSQPHRRRQCRRPSETASHGPRGGRGRHQGQLDFGPWEQIFYGEFDGRRPKRVLVKIIGE